MAESASPQVGILILDYHEPEATLACVRRLLEVEGAATRILWLENDADATLPALLPLLAAAGLPYALLDAEQGALPEPGQVGLIAIAENRGYGGGNNVGLRFLQRHRVPYAWVMNNDTLLARGGSADLVRAAEADPGVGLWAMGIASGAEAMFQAWQIQERDFATNVLGGGDRLQSHPMAYISGCAMFCRTDLAMQVGGIPEEYFLFYEDADFSWAIRRAGHRFAAVDGVEIRHTGSLSTGRRSALMEFYCRRNRWRFIQKYFPERLAGQVWRMLTYQMQKLAFRGKFARMRLEWLAYRDFRAGRLGRTNRTF